MNCKKGDLAFIVPAAGCMKWATGRVVRCVSYVRDKKLIGGHGWKIDPHLMSPDGRVWRMAADASLRPIGNPGDDAQDETLQWLPAPNTREPA